MGSVFQHWAAQSSTSILEQSVYLGRKPPTPGQVHHNKMESSHPGISSSSVIKASTRARADTLRSPSHRRAVGFAGMQNHEVVGADLIFQPEYQN